MEFRPRYITPIENITLVQREHVPSARGPAEKKMKYDPDEEAVESLVREEEPMDVMFIDFGRLLDEGFPISADVPARSFAMNALEVWMPPPNTYLLPEADFQVIPLPEDLEFGDRPDQNEMSTWTFGELERAVDVDRLPKRDGTDGTLLAIGGILDQYDVGGEEEP